MQNLDYDLLQAIISTESSWITSATRYEPSQDKYLVTPDIFAKLNSIDVDKEITLQKTSFGLAQLMGYNFRDLGFKDSLEQTFDPAINIKYMCLFFKRRCNKYPKLEDKIASYNAGSPRLDSTGKYVNQGYVDKVMGFYNKILKGQ
jgi:soluble lytic murein transglycosylase-like protein